MNADIIPLQAKETPHTQAHQQAREAVQNREHAVQRCDQEVDGEEEACGRLAEVVRRRLFNIASAVSLLLCVATVYSWLRVWHTAEVWQSSSPKFSWDLISERRGVAVTWISADQFSTFQTIPYKHDRIHRVFNQYGNHLPGKGIDWKAAGIRLARRQQHFGPILWQLCLPFWLPIGLSLLLPSWWVYISLRRRKPMASAPYVRTTSPAIPAAFARNVGRPWQEMSKISICVKYTLPAKYDSEYVRGGMINMFMTFEPLAGWRHVEVTDRKTSIDFARLLRKISDEQYSTAKQLVLVCDNLSGLPPFLLPPSMRV